MSIHTFGEKIKGRVGEHRSTLLYILILALVAIGAFYLGYSAHSSLPRPDPVLISCPESAYFPKNLAAGQGTATASSVSSEGSTSGSYVASKNGSKYYPVDCAGVSRIKDENKVYFASASEAESAGYSLSQTCSH